MQLDFPWVKKQVFYKCVLDESEQSWAPQYSQYNNFRHTHEKQTQFRQGQTFQYITTPAYHHVLTNSGSFIFIGNPGTYESRFFCGNVQNLTL